MKKLTKFRVVWDETYTCSKVVEAETEAEAMEMCYNEDCPDTKNLSHHHDFSVIRESELNPEMTEE